MPDAAIIDFWKSEGTRHITPQGLQCPEGWDVWEFLGDAVSGQVVEVGCGIGRLARAFNPDQYLGVDINPTALEQARESNPGHRFEAYTGQSAPTILLYTVALHVPDEDLSAFVERLGAKRVILAEIMGRKWRREGNPPVFNRDPEDYMVAFGVHGYKLEDIKIKPYRHYKGENIHFLEFVRA